MFWAPICSGMKIHLGMALSSVLNKSKSAITSLFNIKKKNYGPFLWMGFNCLRATATSRRQFTFYHSVPRKSWYSFYRPRKDERLSRPWSHPVVLNTGPLQKYCLLLLMRQNFLLKTFLRTLILTTQVSLYLFSLLEVIWNFIIFL